jgi:anti-sigma factor RsiW
MSVHTSGREALASQGAETPPPLRLLQRPPARAPRPSAPPAPPARGGDLLAWARRHLRWLEPEDGGASARP